MTFKLAAYITLISFWFLVAAIKIINVIIDKRLKRIAEKSQLIVQFLIENDDVFEFLLKEKFNIRNEKTKDNMRKELRNLKR